MQDSTTSQHIQTNEQIKNLRIPDRTSTLSPKNPMTPISDSYQESVQALLELTKGRSDSTAHAVILAIFSLCSLIIIAVTSIVIFLNISS